MGSAKERFRNEVEIHGIFNCPNCGCSEIQESEESYPSCHGCGEEVDWEKAAGKFKADMQSTESRMGKYDSMIEIVIRAAIITFAKELGLQVRFSSRKNDLGMETTVFVYDEDNNDWEEVGDFTCYPPDGEDFPNMQYQVTAGGHTEFIETGGRGKRRSYELSSEGSSPLTVRGESELYQYQGESLYHMFKDYMNEGPVEEISNPTQKKSFWDKFLGR